MSDPIQPGFTGSPLVRLDHEREHPDQYAARRADPDAGLLLLNGLDPLVSPDGKLSWGPLFDAPMGADLALLGLIDGMPSFVALTGVVGNSFRSPALTQALDLLQPGEAATYAAARSLVDWHARHSFCARCGETSHVIRAGWARKCDSCGAEHFPRTDPVVIMLAEYEGRVLIGRQGSWGPGRFSALAGFVEVGESIEEAVARELFEEAGVRATSVRYLASQPWPFGSSLMMACVAPVESDAVTLDTNELDEAIWVSREEVSAALAGEAGARFAAPPPYAIAHTLFKRWLAGG